MKMRPTDLCCVVVFMAAVAAMCARADARPGAADRHGRVSKKFRSLGRVKHAPSDVVYPAPSRHHSRLKPSHLSLDSPNNYKRNHRDAHAKYAIKSPKWKVPHKRPIKRRYPKPINANHDYKTLRDPHAARFAEQSSQQYREYLKIPRYHSLRHESYGHESYKQPGYQMGGLNMHKGQLPDDKEMYDEFPSHIGGTYRNHDMKLLNPLSSDNPMFSEPPVQNDDLDMQYEQFKAKNAGYESDAGFNSNLIMKLFKKKYPPKKSYNKYRHYLKNVNHVVGGQYAEPPARVVPDDDEEFSFGDTVSSATVSSYINYKNSNLAFSPQNLNDVFSISD